MGAGAIATLASVDSLYDRAILEAGREPAFLFFVAFLGSFGFIRTSAHMIKAQVSWWPGNVEVGGTHIHHLVWGICVVLITGWIGVTQDLEAPWAQIVPIAFGIGAGLTMDEFALWLNLRDVYWEEEGRRSIDAVIFVVAITGLLLIGFRSWVDVATGVENYVFHVVGWSGLVAIIAIAINVAKEKFGMALLGVLLMPVAVVGALRLGRPTSLIARRYDDEKRRRAHERFDGRSAIPVPARLQRRLHRRRPDSAARPESDQVEAPAEDAGASGSA
jgi:lysyl-tRNA synthetase class 2